MKRGFTEACALVVSICFLGAAGTVQAAPSARSLAQLRTYVSQELNNSIERDGAWHDTPDLSLTLAIPGEGFFTLHLTKARLKNWHSYIVRNTGLELDTKDVALFKGYLFEKARVAARAGAARERFPVAASVYQKDGNDFLQLSFKSRGIRGKKTPRLVHAALPMTRDGQTVRVSRPSSFGMLNKLCGNETHSHELAHAALAVADSAGDQSQPPAVAAATALKIAEVSTDADYEWYTAYGSNSNAQIASILNIVETIYENQLQMGFQLREQHVFTTSSDPYSTTESVALLGQFQNYTRNRRHLGQADFYFLFSGKNFDQDVVGISYVGAMCFDPDYAFATAQRVSSSMTPVIVAHEIGHLLNASHDDATSPPSIMSTRLPNPPPNQFSNISKNEINTFVQRYGALCLSSGSTPESTPTPAPTGQPTIGPGTPIAGTPIPGQPTPTPGGGSGGGSAGGGTPVPTVTPPGLTVSLNKKGEVKIDITVAQPDPSCSVTVRASSAKENASRGTRLISFLADQPAMSYTVRIPRRVSSGKPARVYLVAKESCAGVSTASVSRVRSVTPTRVQSRKMVSLGDWIKLLRHGLLQSRR